MKKRRYLYQIIGIMAFAVFSLPLTIQANETNNDANGKKRADIITINTLKSFGDLERKEVPFFHDAHTDALNKINKSCDTCHLTREILGKEGMSFKFKRLEDTGRQEVMDTYHTGCIACHKEMAGTGNKSGPVEECGECHKESETISSRQPIEFDKSLHSLHIEMNDENCTTCHHTGEKDGSCRYCHKNENSENTVSMEGASHLSCIGCHRELSGPAKCSECHDIDEQPKFDMSEDITRPMVGQPDFTIIGAESPDNNRGKPSFRMNTVPFNHMAHEESQDTCRSCHHAALDSCTKSCHTNEGSKNGNMITAEQAMHQLDSKRSCIGCHESNKNRKECAGCHGQMAKGNSLDDTCLKCHMDMPEAVIKENQKPESIAAMLLKTGKTASGTIEDKDIPEVVTIDELSSQYGAVEFMHRQHIDSLMPDIKNNNLAGFFHNGEKTLCLGCHHNSPASKTPPQCAGCHSKSSADPEPLRPDLKVAYHQQCMGCHNRMGIEEPESTNCTVCHKVIGVNKLYDF
jgi:hypothetical protein